MMTVPVWLQRWLPRRRLAPTRPPITLVHRGADEAYADQLHAVAATPGYLSDLEEQEQIWAQTTTRHDLDRLDAICDRLVLHRLNVVVEQAIRQLLAPADRAWVRIQTGEFALVGVA